MGSMRVNALFTIVPGNTNRLASILAAIDLSHCLNMGCRVVAPIILLRLYPLKTISVDPTFRQEENTQQFKLPREVPPRALNSKVRGPME